jgi:hypothetical protein
MQEITATEIRVRQAAALPDLLAASFDAFELVRATARSCDDRTPELFAAFMMTADAAVDGREAITAAPALPAGSTASMASVPTAATAVDEITAALAALGELLNDRLASAASGAAAPGDKAACAEAADAAERIRHLMARGDDDRDLR